jgi:hypothetical protein
MDSLFPGFQMPAVDSKTVVVAEPKEKKAKKPRSPKKEAAEPATVVEVPVVAESPKKKKAKKAKKEAEPAVAAEVPLPESPAPAAAAESPKKKRAPMTEEAKAAAKAKREAKKAANNEVDALANGMAAMTVAEPNLKKIDTTWKKYINTAAKALGKEVTDEMRSDVLAYVNRLTKKEFDLKKGVEHVTDFLAPQTASNAAAEPEEKKEPVDLDIVEFNGQDYFVGPPLGQPPKRRVYEGVGTRDDDTGAYENYNGIGWVGMAAFEMMKVE